MKLTPEQQAVLDGSKGAVMAKVMKTLVMYGDAFGAEKMVPVTSTYGHTVISFGINAMKPVYDLYDQLIEAGAFSEQKFTADPLPLDKNVPSNPLQDLVFHQFMYKQQARYEAQLRKLGILSDKDYTCTCYLDEVGNKPKQGEVLSWAESSAVVYANSVLGARCNRNSGMIELMGSIAGCVPYFGFLTDDGRKADWIVEVRTTKKPEPQLLGSAIGMKVMEKVPYVKGLDQWIGTEINEDAIAYLKDFGAATASNGAVGLYHIEHLTPEAVQQGEALIRDGAPVYVIDDAELQRVRESYPCVWKNLNAKPKLCFMGCPHMTLHQLIDTTERVEASLSAHGQRKVCIPTVFTPAPMSESLFLLLTAAALYFARTRRPILGGLCGAYAAFTRSLGLLLFVPLLWELVHDAVQRRRVDARQVVGALLVPLGFAAYCYINWRVSGNPLQFLIYQREHWNQRTGLFFSTAAYQTDYFLRSLTTGGWRDALGLWLPNLIACFAALGLLAAAAPKLRASQTAWFLAYYIVAVGATWLLSAPRYLLVLLPVPMALAQCTRARTAGRVLTALSALASLGYLAAFALRWQVW